MTDGFPNKGLAMHGSFTYHDVSMASMITSMIVAISRWHRAGDKPLPKLPLRPSIYYDENSCTVRRYEHINMVSCFHEWSGMAWRHRCLNKMADIIQTTFSNVFSWMKIDIISRVHLSVSHHWSPNRRQDSTWIVTIIFDDAIWRQRWWPLFR